MANSKEVIAETSSSYSDAGFMQDIIPTAQRVSLLYHMSYLCLGNFPKLERLLRSRALETQQLFGSSETNLLKCILTSNNLVESLFPMLRAAVEKNKPVLAVKYLEKAKTWITEIISDVKDLIQKYEAHNTALGTTTSDIITEKDETEKKIDTQNKEVRAMEDALKESKAILTNVHEQLEDIKEQTNNKKKQLEEYVSGLAKQDNQLGWLSYVVPFIGEICRVIMGGHTAETAKAAIKVMEVEFTQLVSEKNGLRQKEMTLQNDVIDRQMMLTKAQITLGSVPSPEHLGQIQTCLSRIQQIMLELLRFWENVEKLLNSMKQSTFVGEELINELSDLKEEFLTTITKAEEVWNQFGCNCERTKAIFGSQAKDAYKFLEVSPSSLSEEDWQIQYDAVRSEMQEIRLDIPAVATLAITQ